MTWKDGIPAWLNMHGMTGGTGEEEDITSHSDICDTTTPGVTNEINKVQDES